jgi:hypothetical protein
MLLMEEHDFRVIEEVANPDPMFALDVRGRRSSEIGASQTRVYQRTVKAPLGDIQVLGGAASSLRVVIIKKLVELLDMLLVMDSRTNNRPTSRGFGQQNRIEAFVRSLGPQQGREPRERRSADDERPAHDMGTLKAAVALHPAQQRPKAFGSRAILNRRH